MITYKEFEARAKELDSDLTLEKEMYGFSIKKDGKLILFVEKIMHYGLQITWAYYLVFKDERDLFDLAVELASTPPKERYENEVTDDERKRL